MIVPIKPFLVNQVHPKIWSVSIRIHFPSLLELKKDTFFLANGICFYPVTFKLMVEDELSFNFGLGIRNDTIFTCMLPDLNYETISNIQTLLDLRNESYPRNIRSIPLFPRKITLDSIYIEDNENVFRLDSFMIWLMGKVQDIQ